MSVTSSPEIQEAVKSIFNDGGPTNWVLLSYAAPKGHNLVFTSSGEGGVNELLEKFDETQVQFGYARVEYAVDAESKRIKFVLIIWLGEKAGIMRKAGVGQARTEVQSFFRYNVEVTTGDKAEITEEEVVDKMKRAGGANYGPGK